MHAPKKHARALEILTEPFGVSAQVLAEFYTNAIRKGPHPLSPEIARQWVANLARKPCQIVDANLVREGINLSQRFELSYWDGAIIAAAARLGCKCIYTEDLNNGQAYGAVTVINPFI
ncbi:PIN domain-containing protein [Salaquimonas pukyongi]|uniref:PIN domain-containing protein n=1 Tax=Salaquimonas pukyongi TaxID=2712698 RepID=UPI001FCE0598|nr:PIN domain-containing protein [Salaquimonas pukyongi]